jgi:hypothetical protein
LKEDGWTPESPLIGLAMTAAVGGEEVAVKVAGHWVFSMAEHETACVSTIRTIYECAKALGWDVPDPFYFHSGQVFWANKRVVEVRLYGYYQHPDGAAAAEAKGEPIYLAFVTNSLPLLQVQEDGSLQLDPADEGRTHLSACMVRRPKPDNPQEEEAFASLLWDLDANRSDAKVAPPGEEDEAPAESAALTVPFLDEAKTEGQRTTAGSRLVPFGLSFGPTRAEAQAHYFVKNLHQLHLPRRWQTIPRWDDLVAEEIQRLQEDFGEDAFRRDAARDEKLRRRTDRQGREVVSLAPEAERGLRIRSGLGSAGFRAVDPKSGREYLVRLVQFGAGYLEVGLSWFGRAGPLVDEWREQRTKEAEQAQREALQGVPFENLADEERGRLDAMLARIRCWDYGRKILEAVLGQVGRQAQNPVVVPAEELRVLLGLRDDRNWKEKVDGALEGLRYLDSKLRAIDLDRVLYGYATALTSWTYIGRGPGGGHGEGEYFLEVGQQFLGCLRAFESGRRKLRGGLDAVTYDWSREVPADERAALGWTRKSREGGKEAERFHAFDAGRVFYHAAEGLTPEQDRLVDFLERELTLRQNAAAKDGAGQPWTKRVRSDAEDANEPRLYDQTFCPLLPEGLRFHGALGHFTKNAECGRTLGGTARREGPFGGAHYRGLLAEMGYLLEPGGATEHRRQAVEDALQDLRAVVVDYLHGLVVARGPSGQWLTAEEAQGLPWDALVNKTRWLLFLPETWREDRRRRWQEKTGFLPTEDEAEARRVREARRAGEDEAVPAQVGPGVGLEGSPLYVRLHVAMKGRGLTQGAVAQLFGVSQPAVSLWFKGTEPDPETGAVKGKPIPVELRPLLERWVTTGEPPTADELAARRTRRSGRRAG